MLNKQKELNRLIKDFNALVVMDADDYKNGNIDIDKLLFNANCRIDKLNQLVHHLKNYKG